MFYFSPGYVSLQRVGGAGAMNLGQAAISEMARKNRLRVEIRANKDDSTFGLLIDDRLVQRWKDGAGFLAQGSGVVFFQQLEGPSVRISNLKVAQWEGDSGMDVLNSAPAKEDVVYLINRDRVSGTLQSLGSGSVSIVTGQGSLDIPLSRVTQITLGSPQTNAVPSGPWELRAYFAGGGTVAFDLERWESAQVTGRSANFGEIAFNPQFIRQLQFNLDRSKAAGGEMEILDQDAWELE
jgi:hypothetical protein